MCNMHYKRVLRRGTTVLVNPGWPENLLRKLRFMPPTTMPTGCIEFTGSRDHHDYGRLGKEGRTTGAHRAAYEMVRGPIPDDLPHLDHLCRNPPCVNPAHLEPVTPKENTRRGITGAVNAARQLAKTHCAQGHPFDDENTYVYQATGYRACRTCRSQWKKGSRVAAS